MPAIFQNFGTQELVLIFLIALILFGKRLPEVGRSLGRGILEFKKGLKGVEVDVDKEVAQAEKDAADRKRLEDKRNA